MSWSTNIGSLVLTSLSVAGCMNSAGESATETTTSTTTTAGPTSDSGSSQTDTTTTTEATTGDDSTGSSTETTDDSTTNPFAMVPDGPAGEEECSTFAEDCPENQKCMPYAKFGNSAWSALKCVDVTGQGLHGDPCTVEDNVVSGIDDCALHHMCWDVDPNTLMGHCISFCDGDPQNPTCDEPNTVCVIAIKEVLNICLPACNPLMQDCIEGQLCIPVNNSYSCAPSIAPDDSGLEGDPCLSLNACQPGLLCAETENLVGCMSVGCCTPYCDITEQNPCPNPETTCNAIYHDNPDYPTVGYCGAPICDPLLQNCPDGQGCYPSDNSYGCEDVLELGSEGDPCTMLPECQPGLTCREPEQLLNCEHSKCCTPLCDLNAQDPCPTPGSECIAVYENNLDYPNIGYCGVP